MKKCPSCGVECEDSVKFCTECGAAFPEEPDFFVSPAPAPVSGGKQLKLKELTGSKLALILVITFTIMLLGSIFTTVQIPEMLSEYSGEFSALFKEYAGEYLDQLPAEDLQKIDDALANGFTVNLGSAIGQKLFPILTAIALWILFISAKNKDEPCCSSAGFKIIRVLKIIGFILRIILFAALALILVLVTAAMSDGGGSEYAAIPLGILVGAAVIFIFTFFFYTGLIRTLKTLSCVADGKECRIRVSGYAAFIYILGGIVEIISAVLLAIYAKQSSGVYAFAAVVLFSAISDFAIGKYIRRCKKLREV